jgi:hypothetical protein
MTRCRICTANDREALIEDMARAMWDSQESTNPDDEWQPWDKAPPYWHGLMRSYATDCLKQIEKMATSA